MSMLDDLNFSLGKSEFTAGRVKIYADLAKAIEGLESLQSILQKRILRAAEKKRNIHLVYRKWFRNLATGVPLSDAAKQELPPFDYMVLSTFERAGRIEEGLKFLSHSIGRMNEARSTMRKALIGPGIVMTMALVMITGFSLFVVPMITQIYPPERWPTIGKLLYAVSEGIKNYGSITAFLIIALIVGVIYSLPRLTGSLRIKLDKWPVYSTYRRVNGLTTLVGLASQLKVGVSLVESVRLISNNNTPYMKWMLGRVSQNLSRTPDAYGKAFDIGLFDDEIMFRLIDFAEQSSFPRAVEEVGMESFDEVITGIKESSEVIGGLAKAVAGAIITFMIVSFLFTAQGIKKDVQEQMYSQGR